YNEYPKEITTKDTCNSALYFAVGFDTSATFMTSTINDKSRLNIYKLSTGASCTSVYCPNFDTDIKKVNDLRNGTVLHLSPNPTQGNTTIYTTSAERMHIKLYDNLGKLVLDETLSGTNEYTLNLANQAEGIYFLWAEQGNTIQKEKIIVVR